jgi:hypothetical protein
VASHERVTTQEDQLSDIETAFVCNLGVMNPEERARHDALSRKLMSAREERRELANGYAFKLASQKIALTEVAEWIAFELRCCPFFNLQIEAEPNDGPIWLRMTGATGIKQFILSEIGG